MSRVRRILVLGNPENRRVVDFQRALHRCGWSEAELVTYEDALACPDALEKCCDAEPLLRIDSPGENPAVAAALLQWGAEVELPPSAERIEASDCKRLGAEIGADTGRIRAPAQLAAGFERFLQAVEAILQRTGVTALTPPPRIAEVTDKHRCHDRLRAAGVRQPRRLEPPGSYESLRESMLQTGSQRVFLKLRHGSSASGVVALRTREGSVQATTSVELAGSLDEPLLYNSLRIQRYASEKQIAVIVDALCAEGAIAEEWVPKESDETGFAFDLRILCVAGEPAHTVVRTSSGPITNLHLGNQRGSVAAVRTRLGEDAWRGVREAARAAAIAYSDCLQLGVDLLVARGRRTPYVLEANAFGDLLPGVLWDGLDAYAAQLRALEADWEPGRE